MNEEIGKPVIGIANSFNEIIPGHMHLRNLVQAVKDGIREAGGIPMEFNTIGICDGTAMNHIGMKYSLVTRQIVADSIEATGHGLHRLTGSCSFRTATRSYRAC